jgi:hypothetical protein
MGRAGVQENEPGKQRDMEANASKHASRRVHACARARARVGSGVMVYSPLISGGDDTDGIGARVVVR